VFDSWSETLGGIFPFKEIVRKGTFTETIKLDDIRALFNHDPNFVLGRNKAGTLELEEDEIGLRVVITPPDTSWANDLIKNLRRGDISQMSIGFIVLEDTWGTQDGIDIREIKKVQLFDVSIVTYPAYTQTDVGVRAMESYKDYRSKLDEAQNAVKRAKEKQKLQNIKTKIKNL
jgi:HK97 family phage prohead protease